ncbi:MAG: 7,8-didemethyl-8-hydroxy-5-deazariboflavin synthase subunit CofH [Candidatus Lindowbacteria bacterium RIFCSPLOWO2_12_FULL_62_27]|nr:MAG: 7,8-didemethyl-8-hydroxy-5-deazariboflavin synthase subunit CofH [Candidatus Lindowbacteria bacterium RIFCSPLOWO2_02_FULL_62_12]OGH62560.1 MAG: 7,8-didemethyl-8-hydroxy-5-deazariboflavin synthase subunit CofH [Candidatus Lindowbacteria bacterium RIFCSPLOWO2_12_FULL_62_27]
MSDREIGRILDRTLSGKELTPGEALRLFQAEGKELRAILQTADAVRRAAVGDTVTFVIVRNVNFTNICYTGCKFCGFAKRKGDPEAEFLSLDEIARRVEEAQERGATEVCIQGGLHPNIEGTYYGDILTAIKDRAPDIHIHAFSPFEIKYGAGRMGVSTRDFLLYLKDCGLGTIPGTAAEILDVEIRQQLTRDKLTAAEWIDIVKTAHRLGIRSTATMMYGHIDRPEHWVAHFNILREIQKETGGFTEFVPLGFIHWDAPLYFAGGARPGPTRDENLKVHAIARLFFNGWINHIQVSWVKLGPRFAQYVLKNGGANDFGGTLMNESISRSAGAPYGQEVTPLEMCRMIREIGRRPARRNTLYQIAEPYDDHDPPDMEPLVPRTAEQSSLFADFARQPG